MILQVIFTVIVLPSSNFHKIFGRHIDTTGNLLKIYLLHKAFLARYLHYQSEASNSAIFLPPLGGIVIVRVCLLVCLFVRSFVGS